MEETRFFNQRRLQPIHSKQRLNRMLGDKIFVNFKCKPDEKLNMFGMYAGIKKAHLPTYRQLTRGEDNGFV